MTFFKAAASAAIGLGLAIIAACSTGPANSGAQLAADRLQSAGQPLTHATYRLGSGDTIKIIVFGEDELSGDLVVDGQGAITMALIGQVPVHGLTLAETQAQIVAKLKDGWMRDPKVTADLVRGRPYYILGEINRAGEYPFTSGLTLMNAIAAAGDFTYRADRKKVMITGADGVEREVEITQTTPVHPGDRIRVRERFF